MTLTPGFKVASPDASLEAFNRNVLAISISIVSREKLRFLVETGFLGNDEEREARLGVLC